MSQLSTRTRRLARTPRKASCLTTSPRHAEFTLSDDPALIYYCKNETVVSSLLHIARTLPDPMATASCTDVFQPTFIRGVKRLRLELGSVHEGARLVDQPLCALWRSKTTPRVSPARSLTIPHPLPPAPTPDRDPEETVHDCVVTGSWSKKAEYEARNCGRECDDESSELVVRAIPPKDQDWMTKSATLISYSDIDLFAAKRIHLYINHSIPAQTPTSNDGTPPPPSRALLLLSHPRTHQTLSHAYAQRLSTAPTAQSVSSVSSDVPPPYPGTPPLPPRSTSKSPQPRSEVATPPALASGTSTPGKPIKTKEKLLLSAILILSTVDDSIKRTFDVRSQRVSAVVARKYGPEAGRLVHPATHTARNITPVYARVGGAKDISRFVVDKQVQAPKNRAGSTRDSRGRHHFPSGNISARCDPPPEQLVAHYTSATRRVGRPHTANAAPCYALHLADLDKLKEEITRHSRTDWFVCNGGSLDVDAFIQQHSATFHSAHMRSGTESLCPFRPSGALTISETVYARYLKLLSSASKQPPLPSRGSALAPRTRTAFPRRRTDQQPCLKTKTKRNRLRLRLTLQRVSPTSFFHQPHPTRDRKPVHHNGEGPCTRTRGQPPCNDRSPIVRFARSSLKAIVTIIVEIAATIPPLFRDQATQVMHTSCALHS
ncbi:hypothetical protein L226DRAFT_576743 [Lentinus tigrinus ALCF2SS1-7]|uniref:uncharacterized protein n=1 Tax=Lentinus tigrinus ALCF2SS1-7 TaxID=1328758 RepID=UPI001165E4FD|nr:hypothetical protein L226DRAFT_576743 [Lentinus tigrinus ALCF2SS1-7]